MTSNSLYSSGNRSYGDCSGGADGYGGCGVSSKMGGFGMGNSAASGSGYDGAAAGGGTAAGAGNGGGGYSSGSGGGRYGGLEAGFSSAQGPLGRQSRFGRMAQFGMHGMNGPGQVDSGSVALSRGSENQYTGAAGNGYQSSASSLSRRKL